MRFNGRSSSTTTSTTTTTNSSTTNSTTNNSSNKKPKRECTKEGEDGARAIHTSHDMWSSMTTLFPRKLVVEMVASSFWPKGRWPQDKAPADSDDLIRAVDRIEQPPSLYHGFLSSVATDDQIAKVLRLKLDDDAFLRKLLDKDTWLQLVVFSKKQLLRLKEQDGALYDLVCELYEEEEAEEEEGDSLKDAESVLLEAGSIHGLVDIINSLNEKLHPAINHIHARSLQLSNMTHWAAKSALPLRERGGEPFKDVAMRMRWDSTEEGYYGSWLQVQLMIKGDSGHPTKESVCVPVALAAARRGAVMTHPIKNDSSVLYGPGGTGRGCSEIRKAARAPAKRHPETCNTIRPNEALGAKQDTPAAADGSYSAYLPELGILKSLAHPPAVAPATSSVVSLPMASATPKPFVSASNPHTTSYVGGCPSSSIASATEASSSALPAEHEETSAPQEENERRRLMGATLDSALLGRFNADVGEDVSQQIYEKAFMVLQHVEVEPGSVVAARVAGFVEKVLAARRACVAGDGRGGRGSYGRLFLNRCRKRGVP